MATLVILLTDIEGMADPAGQVRHARAALRVEAELQLPPHPQPRLMLALGALWPADFGIAESAATDALQLARDLGRVPDQIWPCSISFILTCTRTETPTPNKSRNAFGSPRARPIRP